MNWLFRFLKNLGKQAPPHVVAQEPEPAKPQQILWFASGKFQYLSSPTATPGPLGLWDRSGELDISWCDDVGTCAGPNSVESIREGLKAKLSNNMPEEACHLTMVITCVTRLGPYEEETT